MLLDAEYIDWLVNLNELFKNTIEGVVISDPEGCIAYANPGAERLFGYEADELAGKQIEELMPSRYGSQHRKYRNNFYTFSLARVGAKHQELVAKKLDGSEFPVEISLFSCTRRDKSYVISIIVDVTEKKKYVNNMKKINQNLEQIIEERTSVLQKAMEELEESKELLTNALKKEKELNEMKSRFITMASHEFRTPLSAISLSLSLMEQYEKLHDHEKHKKHAQRIKSAVTNMTLILGDFLSTEKLNKGIVIAEKKRFSLREVALEVMDEMNNLLQPGQKINYVHEGFYVVYLDKLMMRNTLMNLVSNAIKFSKENSRIGIFICVSAKEILIRVSDEGIGIPEGEQKHIFEQFFRAGNATNIAGTGLGLSIIAKYMELMDGTIDFTSELDKGTTFTMTLPNRKD